MSRKVKRLRRRASFSDGAKDQFSCNMIGSSKLFSIRGTALDGATKAVNRPPELLLCPQTKSRLATDAERDVSTGEMWPYINI